MQDLPQILPGVLFRSTKPIDVADMLAKIKLCELKHTFEMFPYRHNSNELLDLHKELASQIQEERYTYAEALYKLWQKGGYIQVCPVPAAEGNGVSTCLADYRRQHEWRCGIGAIQDVFSTSLAMAGWKGTLTHLHVDEGTANNACSAVFQVCDECVVFFVLFYNPSHVTWQTDITKKTVLARWHCFHPKHRHLISTKVEEWELGNSLADEVLFNEEQICELAKTLELGKDIVIIDQRHGDRVIVPPGWIHQVENLRPNFKISWDYIEPIKLPVYLWVRYNVAYPFWGRKPDALAMMSAVLHAAKHYHIMGTQ